MRFTEPDKRTADSIAPEQSGNRYTDEFGVVWDIGKSKEIGDWGLVSSPVCDMELGTYVFHSGKGGG